MKYAFFTLASPISINGVSPPSHIIPSYKFFYTVLSKKKKNSDQCAVSNSSFDKSFQTKL